MKTKFLFPLFSASLLFLFACCTGQKPGSTESGEAEQAVDAVRTTPEYAYTDSLMAGSHKVVYSITSQPDSTLQVIVDEDGTKYRDTRWSLTITKDGRELFSRSFTKADFKSLLPEDFRRLGIMDGLRFHHAAEGKLYFNTCVSLPDSDMTCPFLLTVGPDGSYSLTPDTTDPEEDELPPTQPEEAV